MFSLHFPSQFCETVEFTVQIESDLTSINLNAEEKSNVCMNGIYMARFSAFTIHFSDHSEKKQARDAIVNCTGNFRCAFEKDLRFSVAVIVDVKSFVRLPLWRSHSSFQLFEFKNFTTFDFYPCLVCWQIHFRFAFAWCPMQFEHVQFALTVNYQTLESTFSTNFMRFAFE